MTTVSFKKEKEEARAPHRPPTGSLHDLFSVESCSIPPHSVVAVNTGIQLELPEGVIGQIFSRSSLALKHDLTVSTGTIDAAYRGSIYVVLRNNAPSEYLVCKGDRIAQLAILSPLDVDFVQRKEISGTLRGQSKFGSTGR